MTRLTPIAQLSKEKLAPEDYVVFGGTFDPPHEGHVCDIKTLQELFSLVIIAPTTLNPWKKAGPRPADLSLRLEMIRLACAAEQIPIVTGTEQRGVYLYQDGYVYAAEVVRALRTRKPGMLYWAVGEDISDSVHKWKDWGELEVTALVLPIVYQTHSLHIRRGDKEIHPALVDFARRHGLYEE